MIILPVEQGSTEWLQARLGIPTASRFDDILTPKTMKPSSASRKYIAELVAEWVLGEPLDSGQTDFMERGTSLEKQAIAQYEIEHDVKTTEAGFVLRDDRLIGCSPDRLIGDDGGLEIKAPSAKKHMAYLLGIEELCPRGQVQGGIWICERSYWDVMSFNPYMPPVLRRYERDEEYLAHFEPAMESFLERLAAAKDKARELGCVPMEEQMRAATEKATADRDAKEEAAERAIFGDVA